MEDYIKKAAEAFLVERPYGIVDYSTEYVLNLKELRVYNQYMLPLAVELNKEPKYMLY